MDENHEDNELNESTNIEVKLDQRNTSGGDLQASDEKDASNFNQKYNSQ